MRYCESPYFYQRRKTREVIVGDLARGGVILGGDHPVVMQSMLTCDTMDTAECVRQTLELVAVGCQIVRITAPTVKDAANLKNIVSELRARGCLVPIVADIHFKPDAAMEAARWVKMVRVNPGNYADSKKFAIGSLSDRIMNRFGDTPLGMVESALEFARIARKNDFHNFKFSMKSSNPKVMIECYRLLVARLEQEGLGWNYPIHLGVTEAGEGEDGRIKSAIGIGSLLCDGLGDTIRVSLTEDSPREIEVCRDLLAQLPLLTITAGRDAFHGVHEMSGDGDAMERVATTSENSLLASAPTWPFDPFSFARRETPEIELSNGMMCGGEQTVRVVVTRDTWDKVAPKISPKADVKPEAVYEDLNVFEADPTQEFGINCETQLVTVKDGVSLPAITAFRLLAAKLKRLGRNNPILVKDCINFDAKRGLGRDAFHSVPNPSEYGDAVERVPTGTSSEVLEPKIALLRASVVIGSLLADGIGDAILIRGEPGAGQSLRLAYNILQAAGCRSFKTDYVACPSCGRTLFNLQTVTGRIKARTEHLKGVKIAIMGCIVNGPGEMADADFGYVGGAPNKINLYVGKTPIKFNIPEGEAVDRLVDLIKEHGKWVEPELKDMKEAAVAA